MSDSFDPLDPRLRVGTWVSDAFDWFTDTFQPVLDFVDTVLDGAYSAVTDVLSAPPFLVMIVLFAALGWAVRSWKFAVFTVVGFYLIAAMDKWDGAMQTLALVLVAAFIGSALAVPLGIWAARSPTVSNLLRPVLDFMQTMPAMVYLIPTLGAFGIGVVPGMISTIVFAMPPASGSPSWPSARSTPRSSRPGRRSGRRRCASCGRSSCRSRCRRSWPGSTR